MAAGVLDEETVGVVAAGDDAGEVDALDRRTHGALVVGRDAAGLVHRDPEAGGAARRRRGSRSWRAPVTGEAMALDFRGERGAPDWTAAAGRRRTGRGSRKLSRRFDAPDRLAQRLANLARAYSVAGAADAARSSAREALTLVLDSGSQPALRDAYTAFGEAMRPIEPDTAIAAARGGQRRRWRSARLRSRSSPCSHGRCSATTTITRRCSAARRGNG